MDTMTTSPTQGLITYLHITQTKKKKNPSNKVVHIKISTFSGFLVQLHNQHLPIVTIIWPKPANPQPQP